MKPILCAVLLLTVTSAFAEHLNSYVVTEVDEI